jgi:hypothetical protein
MTFFEALRRVLAVGVACALLVLLAVVASRYAPPTAAEKRDVLLMFKAVPPVVGKDGSDLGWLQRHDVPVSERRSVAAQVRAFYRDHGDSAGAESLPGFPLSRFPALEPLPGEDRFSCETDSGCLDEVRAAMDVAADVLASQAKRVALGREMAAVDGVRYGLTAEEVARWPERPIQRIVFNQRLVRIQAAHDSLSGRQVPAVAGICRNLAGWRRISANVDDLLNSAVALGSVRQYAALLAQMLAELPRGQALPSDCDAALAPTLDAELDACNEFRAEFHVQRMQFERPADDIDTTMRWLTRTVGARHRDAVLARRAAVHCGPRALADARAGRSAVPRAREAVMPCSEPRWVVDPVGCVLLGQVDPGVWAKYADRRTDAAAIVAGVRTAAWLRASEAPPEAWADMLARRPKSLGLVPEPRLSADHRTLTIPLLTTWYDKTTASLPLGLPPSR